MNVLLGKKFIHEFRNFPKKDQNAIADFIEHIKINGFSGLEGRNKFSDDIPYYHQDYVKILDFVKKNSLWHYHIGIKQFDMSKPFGDRTSEYIVHYSKKLTDEIAIVDYGGHPPFRLPTNAYLEMSD